MFSLAMMRVIQDPHEENGPLEALIGKKAQVKITAFHSPQVYLDTAGSKKIYEVTQYQNTNSHTFSSFILKS